MIRLASLSFTYAGATRPALRDINLTIPKGTFLGIIGGSGAGKSTLTYVINGMIPHHYNGDFYGTAQVAGQDTFESGLCEIARSVGSVLQDIDSQFVASMVEDELYYGLENFGIPKAEIPQRTEHVLELLGIASLRRRPIASLSGGQKQKVAIAAMLALQPEVLLLDEPTGELDPQSSRQVFSLLRKLNREQGMTIVVVEQKLSLLCEYADQLAVLDAGTLAACGTMQQILSQPALLEQVGICCPPTVTLSRLLADERLLPPDALCLTVPEAEAAVRRVLYA